MKLIIPTLVVKTLLAKDVDVNGKTLKAGTIIPMAYGLALQAVVGGIAGAILDFDEAAAMAVEHMTLYGGDSWFPPGFQTVNKLADYFTLVEKPNSVAGSA